MPEIPPETHLPLRLSRTLDLARRRSTAPVDKMAFDAEPSPTMPPPSARGGSRGLRQLYELRQYHPAERNLDLCDAERPRRHVPPPQREFCVRPSRNRRRPVV